MKFKMNNFKNSKTNKQIKIFMNRAFNNNKINMVSRMILSKE